MHLQLHQIIARTCRQTRQTEQNNYPNVEPVKTAAWGYGTCMLVVRFHVEMNIFLDAKTPEDSLYITLLQT